MRADTAGTAGDLYVVLAVKPHDYFERDGHDLHFAVIISFPQAALGAEIAIQTLEGETVLKIPEGTQSGEGVPAARQGGSVSERARTRRPDRAGGRGDAEEADEGAARGDPATGHHARGGRTAWLRAACWTR